MTRSQRRTHLIAWLVLGPVVVIVLALALAARPDARSQSARGLPASAKTAVGATP